MEKDTKKRLFEIMGKLNEDFTNQQLSLPSDDEIKMALRNHYAKSIYGKAGAEYVENRINQLLTTQSKWLEMAKQQYNAQEIADVLFKYDSNLNK